MATRPAERLAVVEGICAIAEVTAGTDNGAGAGTMVGAKRGEDDEALIGTLMGAEAPANKGDDVAKNGSEINVAAGVGAKRVMCGAASGEEYGRSEGSPVYGNSGDPDRTKTSGS